MGNKGRLMENIVAVELIKGSKNAGFEVFYWKDHQGREVDFIIKEGREITKLIQATYAPGLFGKAFRKSAIIILYSATTPIMEQALFSFLLLQYCPHNPM